MAQVHTAEVEPQNCTTGLAQAARQTVHDFVMHRPAMLRMRVAHDCCFNRDLIVRLFQNGLEPACWSVEEQRFDSPGHGPSCSGNL
jgi:hypothetical protein